MADPKDLKLQTVRGQTLVTSAGAALSDDSKLRLRSQLKNALNAELAASGETLGLKPGDKVAISSSIGQSISF
ncbi:hypothetical protein WME95_29770 [Sorangium sp. So ce327]|jgi:hypothetical protein|uniref:hypothetical protein n=1 Tax=unclassified Sorangium TaxID=2621164 RepID=UPI003F63201F